MAQLAEEQRQQALAQQALQQEAQVLDMCVGCNWSVSHSLFAGACHVHHSLCCIRSTAANTFRKYAHIAPAGSWPV
jgi:hypothetical protein